MSRFKNDLKVRDASKLNKRRFLDSSIIFFRRFTYPCQQVGKEGRDLHPMGHSLKKFNYYILEVYLTFS